MRGCGFCAETEGRAAQGGGPCGLRVPEPRSPFSCQAAGRHPAIKRLVALRI